MVNTKKRFIQAETEKLLLPIFEDNFERVYIVNQIFDDVQQDIEETADKDFTSEDVRIAVARALLDRLGYDDAY